jgi:hypothetical protein
MDWIRPCVLALLLASCAPIEKTDYDRSIWDSPELQSFYETTETGPRASDSRVDFRGPQIRWSGSAYTSAERQRSETGGNVSYEETDLFLSARPTGIVVPKTGLTHWEQAGWSCDISQITGGLTQANCTATATGKRYQTLYSPHEGVVSFQAFCLDKTDETCTYILKGGTGVFSGTMLSKLRQVGLLRTAAQP